MSEGDSSCRYTVLSIDNASFGKGAARMTRCEFNDAQGAIDHAERLVDGALLAQFSAANSADELMTLYTIGGSEVPKIYGEPRIDFHAYQYARRKSEALFATPVA